MADGTIKPSKDEQHQINDGSPPSKSLESHLNWRQKFGYSVGHVLNDLCSALWFSYFLVFMTLVIQLNNQNAGILLLIGQIADGLATPLVGLLSHKFQFCNYGRKKSWHLLGTICVLVSVPLVFNPCLMGEIASTVGQTLYFAVFIVVFQFGWAAIQVSHLSLIPVLTPSSNERIGLNSLRFSWTVISCITVYIITWLVLSVDQDSSSNDDPSSILVKERSIGPEDAPEFRKLIISVLSMGSFFSLIFHLIVREPSHTSSTSASKSDEEKGNIDESLSSTNNHLKWSDWFCVPQFYFVALLYMGTRLVINLTQVYIPFYLRFTLNLRKESIAYIPLFMYCSSFLASLVTKSTDNIFGKKIMYGFGCLISLGAYLWIWCGEGSFYIKYGIFIVVLLLGLSRALILVTSLGFTNDLIGHNTSSGAFVFGVMSFLDKMSNGVAVMIIQKLDPTEDPSLQSHITFHRDVLTFTCGSATLLAMGGLFLILMKPIGVTSNKKDLKRSSVCLNEVFRNSEKIQSMDCHPVSLYSQAEKIVEESSN